MKNALKWIALLAAALLVAFLVPSPSIYAEELPSYTPVELEAAAPLPWGGRAPYAPTDSGWSEDGLSYRDPSMNVEIRTFTYGDTLCTAAFVQIAHASQLRTELAAKYPSKTTARVDVMAKRANAVLAVNGDYFIYHSQGIVYRGGELLRNRPSDEFDGLAVDREGNFHLVCPITKDAYAGTDVATSFAFGPALVVDGQLKDNSSRKVTYKSRTGIGQLAPLTYVLVVTDGPDDGGGTGLNMQQFAQLFLDLGCSQAYNLDGGLSTSMVFHGKKITGYAQQHRAVGDIVYFASAVPQP